MHPLCLGACAEQSIPGRIDLSLYRHGHDCGNMPLGPTKPKKKTGGILHHPKTPDFSNHWTKDLTKDHFFRWYGSYHLARQNFGRRSVSHQRSLHGHAAVRAGQRHVQHLGGSTPNSADDADQKEIEEFGLHSRHPVLMIGAELD